MLDIDKKITKIQLPRLRKAKKLPVVFSQDEVRRLLHNGGNLRSKSILSLLYSAGLRVSELVHMKVCDIDPDRKMIHIRQGKGRKDRYVPLADAQWRVLSAYIRAYKPAQILFYGQSLSQEIKAYEVRDIFRLARQASDIQKEACCHTLRYPNLYKIQTL